MSFTRPSPPSRFDRPRPFYRYRRDGGFHPVKLPQPVPEEREDLTGPHGLAHGPFQSYSYAARRLIAKALRFLGLPLSQNPNPVMTATEAVMFGLFLDFDFDFVFEDPGEGQFQFQSYVLGGRQPGGAVVDFVLLHNGGLIGVRVQSIFHAITSPFSGTAGPFRERDQEIRLLANGFARIVDVNEPRMGFPLENGGGPQIHREMLRVLGRVPSG